MDRTNSQTSSVSDTFCVPWGCELSDVQRKMVIEVENEFLEHQFYIRTICLSADASAEMHIVEVQDKTGMNSMPIASLHPSCQPTVVFNGFEVTPPVTFSLCSGRGPLFISGQHVTLDPEEEEQKILYSTPSQDQPDRELHF